MIAELERKAFLSLTNHFWDSRGYFSFSEKENVTSPSINSVCVLALKSYGEDGINWLAKNNDLLQSRFENSYPWKDAGNHYQNTMAMSFGLIGLYETASTQSTMIDKSIKYLLNQQNNDGGWNFTKDVSEESSPYFTYWATRALLYTKPCETFWSETIKPALMYFIEQIKEYSATPTSYAMIRHGVELIKNRYIECIDQDELLSNRIKTLKNYKIERFQSKNGCWKQEPAIINTAYFRKSLFTMKNLYFLSQIDHNILSIQYQQMLNWISDNFQSPGWPSDTETSKTGISWTTAYILLGLSSYKKALRKYIED